MCGIYKITNKINNKSYIGQSNNIHHRFAQHKSENYRKSYPEKILYKAIQQHGINNFTFEIIEECNQSDLDDLEVYWINFYDTYNNGYNGTRGGKGFDGAEEKFMYKISNPEFNYPCFIDGVYTIKNDEMGIIFQDDYDIADESFEYMTNEELQQQYEDYETMLNVFCEGYDSFESWAECHLI